MLHRNIFVSHLLCFIFCVDQSLIQILSDIDLSALHFRALAKTFFHTIDKQLLLDSHFLDQIRDQTVILYDKSIQQVLLLYLLIAIFIGNFFTSLYRLQ